jgi:hypothetical protein
VASRSATAADPATSSAALSPARLKALEALTTATASRSPAPRYGANVAPGSVSGAWISSLTTTAPCGRTTSSSAWSSAAVQTRPVGLCGLDSSTALAPAPSAASMPGRSSPPPASSGTSTTTRPCSTGTWKKGGYTGGQITTPSPGEVSIRSASATPTMTSATGQQRAGSTCQPQRRAAKEAKAGASDDGNA